MTNDDIIRMAHEAGLHIATDVNWMPIVSIEYAKKFAEVVAAAERNRTWTQDHWTEYERSIAAEEREGCAKLCEEPIDLIQITDDCSEYVYKDHLDCAEAIRARGK